MSQRPDSTPFNLEEICFEEVVSIWRDHLWPGRHSPIEPRSFLTKQLSVDMNVEVFNPRFFALTRACGAIVAVNSGHRVSLQEYRSRGLWVEPKYRRQGMATQLLEKVAEVARLEGCHSLWSLVRHSSVPVYECFGFKGNTYTMDFEFGPHWVMEINL